MKNIIRKIAERQNVESILNRLKSVEQTPTLQIGYIGEFSTGKTSLINSMLGLNLPTDINPCTKAITLIEPREGITDWEYFIEDSEGRRDVSFSEWNDGGNCKALGIRVKPCDVLPEGCLFVDTPGIHSAVGEEAKLTYGYLSKLDAAVFCVNVNSGSLTKPALDFLLLNVPAMIYNRIVFAITFSDQKSPEALENIKKHIAQQINDLGICKNIENKIFCISSKEEGNDVKVYDFIKKNILEHKQEMYAARRNESYKEVASELLAIITEKAGLTSFNDSGIDSEERKISEANRQISLAKANLDSFKLRVKDKIETNLKYGNNGIITAKDSEETKSAINNLLGKILDDIQFEINELIKNFELPQNIMSTLALELQGRLEQIISKKEFLVTATTMVAAAYIGGMTSVGGNVVEALAGGGAREAAKEVAKKTATKTATKVLVAASSDVAINNGDGIKTVINVAGRIIEKLNPFEFLGNLGAQYFKNDVLDDVVARADSIASEVTRMISRSFSEEYIEPYEKAIEEHKKNIEKIRKDKDAFRSELKTLDNDIEALKKIVKE